jgi:hypothetical protein
MSDVENHAVILEPLDVDGEIIKVDKIGNAYAVHGREVAIPGWNHGENTAHGRNYTACDWVDFYWYEICGDRYENVDVFISRIAAYEHNLASITEGELNGEYVAHRWVVIRQGLWAMSWDEHLVVYTREVHEFDDDGNEVPTIVATVITSEMHSVSRWQHS